MLKSADFSSQCRSYRRGLAAQKSPLTPTSATQWDNLTTDGRPLSAFQDIGKGDYSTSASTLDSHMGTDYEDVELYLEEVYSGEYQIGYSRPPTPSPSQNKVPAPDDTNRKARNSRHFGRFRTFLSTKKERL
eukprot:Gregarina_sp_Poly_1__13@NODE_1002_length_5406_cov_137_430043_g703_i0_p6_GENE_NODE_1002_length_5406_cov_137_430043_g703_i0NODE_1002_length_5406_cov_137_430043_g703_i0_p6_ORF_typecomplete_len132_score10_07_NODE_1002_length_5406_cov_137_430043_g703_i038294224